MTEAVVAQRNTVSTTGFANPLNLPANAEVATDVLVYGDDTLLVNGVDYTLAGVGDLGNLDAVDGVDVTIDQDVIDAALYDSFTVVHSPTLAQGSDLSGGGTLGRLYEAGLDAAARRVQSLAQNSIDRSLHLAVDTVDTLTVLPTPEDRRALVWELDQDTGDFRIVNSASDPDGDVLTATQSYADAAAASAAAAEASETEALSQANAAAASAALAIAAAAAAGDLSSIIPFLTPVGTLIDFAGAAAPTYYLACDGSAVSRATYAALFAVIGTTYGAGNGSTTFNLPTFNDGRFKRSTGGNAAARGVLQAEMIGPHSHAASAANGGAHTHTYTATARRGANGDATSVFRPSNGDSSSPTSNPTLTTTSNGDHTHAITVDNNSGTENRPANSAVLVCIKY